MFPHDESDALPPTAALTFRVKPEAAENIVGWHLPAIHVATDKKQEGMGVGVALCMSELAVRQARAGTISMRALAEMANACLECLRAVAALTEHARRVQGAQQEDDEKPEWL